MRRIKNIDFVGASQWETSAREKGQQNVGQSPIVADLPLVFFYILNPLFKTFLIGKNTLKQIFLSSSEILNKDFSMKIANNPIRSVS